MSEGELKRGQMLHTLRLHHLNNKSLASETLSRYLSVPPLSPCKADHLQSVLDGIREVLQRADGDGLLRRVLAGAV